MQSLTVAHAWHYHRIRATTGHVWQGRFKSPVISTDAHLLTVMRYVESNPLRAGMVTDLAEYPWSSYLVHGLGKLTGLVDEAPVWASLAKTEPERQAYWRQWVHTHADCTGTAGRPPRRYLGQTLWSERVDRSHGAAVRDLFETSASGPSAFRRHNMN